MSCPRKSTTDPADDLSPDLIAFLIDDEALTLLFGRFSRD
jgi:hypothetical protein